LAGVHLALPRYIRAFVDGSMLTFDQIELVSRHLAGLDIEGRAANPCVGRERADLVLSGCAILDAICATWPVGRLRVADRGIRVLVLGCGPGGWTQIAAARVGPDKGNGTVVGIDLRPTNPVPGATLIEGDFRDPAVADRVREALGGPADLVLSDMAAPATGH